MVVAQRLREAARGQQTTVETAQLLTPQTPTKTLLTECAYLKSVQSAD